MFKLSFAASIALLPLSLLSRSTAAFSVGFVYDDLLANPQYHVHYMREVLLESSQDAGNIQQGNVHRESKDGSTKRGANISPTGSSAARHIMMAANGQRWSCSYPQQGHVTSLEEAENKSSQDQEEDDRKSITRGLALLDPMNGLCITRTFKWWTYEYCHKRQIRQFHAVNINGNWEPENRDSIYLMASYAPYGGHLDDLFGALPLLQSTVDIPTELEDIQGRRFLFQKWGHGDLCELTNQPRKVEVQYQCADLPHDVIHSVSEPSTCSYIMVIDTPRLCSDPAFELRKTPEAARIECRRVVTDMEYASMKVTEGPESGLNSLGKKTAEHAKETPAFPKENHPLANTATQQLQHQNEKIERLSQYLQPYLTERQQEILRHLGFGNTEFWEGNHGQQSMSEALRKFSDELARMVGKKLARENGGRIHFSDSDLGELLERVTELAKTKELDKQPPEEP